jgi:FixJ family two-component response regulator
MTTPTAYVVDDDESIRSLWQWLMASNGIAVQAFASAAAFIKTYRRADPGCLVLDVRLPGMSGPELQAYLRREAIEIPIVFVSAHGDVPTAVNAMKGVQWPNDRKPIFFIKTLLRVMRSARSSRTAWV